MRLVMIAAAAAAALSALSGSSVAGAAEDGPILPGYWESTSTASFPTASSKTERKCITSRAVNSYLTGPVNNHYSCRYDTSILRAGHAQMAGECVDSGGIHGKITIDGAYAPEAFKLNGRLVVSMLGLKIPIDTSIDAHRISGECPAGVKIEDGNAKPPEARDEPAPGAAPPG